MDEAPIAELDELRPLIAEGHERGFLTFDEIATCLEEVEVTKEQVVELHSYLEDQGIDVVDAEGKPAQSENGDRKSTRLNSSHANISYAVFCLKKTSQA